MILLDTHIWLWWVAGDPRLTPKQLHHLTTHQPAGLGISVISCWEVAKLVEIGRLKFSCSVKDWIEAALRYPGVALLDLTPAMAVASTQLPAPFHRDPADQLLVATARILGIPLLTADSKILGYPHVPTLP